MLIINSNLAVDNRMVDISDAQQIRNSSNLYIGISLMNNFSMLMTETAKFVVEY